jgi:hypothetical protein
MRVHITSILKEGDQDPTVAFVTRYGGGQAIWPGIPPNVQQTYEVELDINEVLLWGGTITAVVPGEPTINQEGHDLVLRGHLDQLNLDGTGSLRIGESIVMFDYTGEPPVAPEFVQIRTVHAIMYDANL